MNGVYIRKDVPRSLVRPGEDVLLYYLHMDGAWTMVLSGRRETEADTDYGMWRPEPVRQWLFVDDKSVDRFTHVGDTIVPGAGVRWKHVHDQSAASRGPTSVFSGAAWPFSQQIVPVRRRGNCISGDPSCCGVTPDCDAPCRPSKTTKRSFPGR